MNEIADSDADRVWFESIERVFIRLRGAPLLLSPADWQVARRWRREGIPLELIVESLEQVFLRRAERNTRGKVNSLRYCAPAVEAAWEERRELLSGGQSRDAGGTPSLSERLRSIAEGLPAGLSERKRLVDTIRTLEGSPESVEQKLGEIESAILDDFETRLAEDEKEAVEKEVESALARLSARLSDSETARTRDLLRRRALRRKAGIPELSLFAPRTD